MGKTLNTATANVTINWSEWFEHDFDQRLWGYKRIAIACLSAANIKPDSARYRANLKHESQYLSAVPVLMKSYDVRSLILGGRLDHDDSTPDARIVKHFQELSACFLHEWAKEIDATLATEKNRSLKTSAAKRVGELVAQCEAALQSINVVRIHSEGVSQSQRKRRDGDADATQARVVALATQLLTGDEAKHYFHYTKKKFGTLYVTKLHRDIAKMLECSPRNVRRRLAGVDLSMYSPTATTHTKSIR